MHTPDMAKAALGRALADALRGAGVTKARLASDLQVSPRTVQRWCSGHRQPSIAHLTAISRQCRTPIAALIGETL